ncbi:MAG: DUF6034 family protein [Oscillospiraceae bacterium]|nr:DUF6034 family protein [Oscillospiraceae bacterium]
MKRMVSFFVSVTLFFVMLTACQPTPDNPIIQGVDHDRLIEMAENEGQNNNYGNIVDFSKLLAIPERYQAQRQWGDERLSLNADAEIFVPDYVLPVVRVEPKNFTQEFVNKVHEILIGDTLMFEVSEELTQQQIELQIYDVRQRSVEVEREFENGNITEEQNFLLLDELKGMLDELEKKYASAPAYVDNIPATAEIKIQNQNGRYINGFAIQENPGFNNVGKNFWVINNNERGGDFIDEQLDIDTAIMGSTLLFWRESGTCFDYEERPVEIANIGIQELSEETFPLTALEYVKTVNAIDIVEGFIENLDINEEMKIGEINFYYVMPSKVLETEKCEFRDTWGERLAEIRGGKFDDEIIDIHINFELNRHHRGVPVTTAQFAGANSDGSFNSHWEYESIGVTISLQYGIISFGWLSPYQIIETVVDSSAMLQFDEITEIFENMFRVHFDETDVIRTGTIDRVTLSLRRVTEQNNIDGGLLVPAWDFWGDIDPPLRQEVWFAHSIEPPMLTINAIDGSVIDLKRGF